MPQSEIDPHSAGGSKIEQLVVGNCLRRTEEQDPALKLYYKDAFEFD